MRVQSLTRCKVELGDINEQNVAQPCQLLKRLFFWLKKI